MVGQSANGGLRTLVCCCCCCEDAGACSDEEDMVVGEKGSFGSHSSVIDGRCLSLSGLTTATPCANVSTGVGKFSRRPNQPRSNYFLISAIFQPKTLCCLKNRCRSSRTGKLLAFRISAVGKVPGETESVFDHSMESDRL